MNKNFIFIIKKEKSLWLNIDKSLWLNIDKFKIKLIKLRILRKNWFLKLLI